jgi:hypothetical protein
MIHSGIDITMKPTSELAKDLGLMMKNGKEQNYISDCT